MVMNEPWPCPSLLERLTGIQKQRRQEEAYYTCFDLYHGIIKAGITFNHTKNKQLYVKSYFCYRNVSLVYLLYEVFRYKTVAVML